MGRDLRFVGGFVVQDAVVGWEGTFHHVLVPCLAVAECGTRPVDNLTCSKAQAFFSSCPQHCSLCRTESQGALS